MNEPQQFGLFSHYPMERGKARLLDPDTSKQAAASVPVADLEARVLRALRICKEGMTTHELSWLLRVDLVSVSPRMRPLVDKNLVVDSGERRSGDSGRKSIVWKAVL